MSRRRLLVEWCAIALFTAAVICGLIVWRASARIDDSFYDLLVGVRAAPPSDRILIVAIDDPSIAAIGRWPWPRTVHARMLGRLAAAAPAVTAYDVLFTEPGIPADDAALASALRAARPVVLPVLFQTPGSNGATIDITPPIAPIAAATTAGHVALLPDADGTARAALLDFQAGGQHWPHLMEATYRQIYHHPSPAFVRAEASGDPAVAIPFRPTGAFRTVSFASVLNGEVPAAFLRDHVILVGVTAGGLGDRYRVPQRDGGLTSGIEIQANLLNGLISDRLVRDVPLALRILLSLLPSGLLLVGFWWLTPARSLAASLSLIVATLLVPALLLALGGWWLPPTSALTGLLLIYPLWGWRRLQAVDRSIGQELAIFGEEPLPTLVAPASAGPLDPVGGQTERLRASIARMRDLRRLVSDTVESVGDPLLVTGLDDHVLLANGAALALLGPDIVGEPAMARLANASTTDKGAELTIADGRTFSLRRSPLCDGDGAQRGWILLLADISAIRTAEREREEALEFLSHDMRSPQASILTLLEQAPAPGPEIGARIAGYARRTLALAENFVQLARLNAGRFDPEDTDLREALIDAVDDVWPQAQGRAIRIEISGDDEPCYLLGDRYALTRAFINLLDNAVRFSPDGGHIRCAMVLVNGGREVDCVIADEGPGVPEDRRAMLFGRFGQRSGPAKRSSGLGLAYVRAVAERHGGSARWEPGTPQGSRFIVRLPVTEGS